MFVILKIVAKHFQGLDRLVYTNAFILGKNLMLAIIVSIVVLNQLIYEPRDARRFGTKESPETPVA